MSVPRREAIVVGLGAMGSAALRSLAGRGLRPLGLERWEPGHDRGDQRDAITAPDSDHFGMSV